MAERYMDWTTQEQRQSKERKKEDRNSNIRKNLLGQSAQNDSELEKFTKVWKQSFRNVNGREPNMNEVMQYREAANSIGGQYIPIFDGNYEPYLQKKANGTGNSDIETSIQSALNYQYPGNANPPQTPTEALGDKSGSRDTTQSVTETSTYSEPKMHVIRNSVDPVYIPTSTAASGGWEKLFYGAEGPAAEVNKANVINAQLYGQYAQMNSPNIQIEQPVLQSRTSSTISNALSQQQGMIDNENKFKPVSEATVRGVGNSQTHSVGYNHLNEPLLFVEDQKITLNKDQWAEVKKRIKYDDAYGQQMQTATNNLVKVTEDVNGATVKYNPGRIIADQNWINYVNDLTDAMDAVIKLGSAPASNSNNPLTDAVTKGNLNIK